MPHGYTEQVRTAGRLGLRGRRETYIVALLELENLHVALEDGTEIVKGVDLDDRPRRGPRRHGPNGSGKSTLSYAIAGHPAYEITEGRILLDGADITGPAPTSARSEGSSWPSSIRTRSRG